MAAGLRSNSLALALAMACLCGPAALAQPAETRSAQPGATRPRATVADMAWLAGEWRGPGIDGRAASETWSGPVGGTMAGHFAQTDAAGGVMFYELIQIVPDGDSLLMRLKHFGPALAGWEEKDKTVDFPLIAREGDSWFFDGLTYRKEGKDRLFVAVRMTHGDGRTDELTFRFTHTRR